MTSINSPASQWYFSQPQLHPETVSKPSPEHLAPSIARSSESAEKNTGSRAASLEHEMFVAEDVSAKRVPRGFSKLFNRAGLGLPATIKAPEGVKAPEGIKAPEGGNVAVAGTSRSLGAGATKFDKDIAVEQSSFKTNDDYAKKLGQEEIVEVELKTFTSTLEVPASTVNGKAVDEFSSDDLGKAGDALDKAVIDSDVKVAPVQYKLSDTKKALITAGTVAIISGVSTTVVEGIKKAFMDKPADIFNKGLTETKIVDQLQGDVFKAANILKRFKEEDEVQPDFQWALKSTEERMTSLESITIALEKDFGKLAGHYSIPFTFSASRSEDPDIEVRGKVIESKLAVITSLANEVALKIKATA
jgi:hypothetical protein